jgi:hypothetical protein
MRSMKEGSGGSRRDLRMARQEIVAQTRMYQE